MTAIVVPTDLWEDGSPAVLGTWLFSDGEQVREGTIVAEVMRDKASYEIAAPASGTLRTHVAEDDEIALGSAIGRID
ncbi:biotin/lipoyl-containing protein [Croceicoccus sediminis]|uniref:biotin/lipoyl-containing protein n=1 Tax=Croceicoccus sediminis TaxID=2571150 RepID=UPI001181DEAF|nr:lipoyl domain-containing protein [Croceicoccus sediminis]